MDGLNLLPLLQGKSVPWRDYAHGEHCSCYSDSEEMQYLCDGKVKYIWFTRTGREQLFDLTEDPYECHDLSGNPEWRGTLQKLRQRLASELDPRGIRLKADGTLPVQDKPFISPLYRKRLEGMTSAERAIMGIP